MAAGFFVGKAVAVGTGAFVVPGVCEVPGVSGLFVSVEGCEDAVPGAADVPGAAEVSGVDGNNGFLVVIGTGVFTTGVADADGFWVTDGFLVGVVSGFTVTFGTDVVSASSLSGLAVAFDVGAGVFFTLGFLVAFTDFFFFTVSLHLYFFLPYFA